MFRIAIVVLGLAVFAWGFQYKLSLYHQAPNARPGDVVKLIQGERSSQIAVDRALHHCQSAQFPMQWTVIADVPAVLLDRNHRADNATLPIHLYVPPIPFVRPPPAAA